jgi:hypothetical protein
MHSRIFAAVVTAAILLTAGDALAVGSSNRPRGHCSHLAPVSVANFSERNTPGMRKPSAL